MFGKSGSCMSNGHLFTIGHSTLEFPCFVGLLKRHRVDVVADVRSRPHSRLEDFSRPTLEAELKSSGVRCLFLGAELGARRNEPECYVGDRADYERIARLPAFAAGLDRLERESRSSVTAIMCAEKDPLDSHRAILVCRQLSRRGWRIDHIVAEGELESHSTAERRLVREMNIERTLFEPDLTENEMIEQAYDKRASRIAYRTTMNGTKE